MLPDGKISEVNLQVDKSELDDRLAKNLSRLEDWYTAEFDRRLLDLAQILHEELQSQVEEIRVQYEDRYQQLTQKSEQQSQDRTPPVELSDEISRCEMNVAKCTAELERLVADDSVALGRLLQIRSEELELKAYLRGLKFFSSRTSR